MEYKILEIEYNDLLFKIEEDFPEVGAYLYVYKNGKCIKDYLQNNIETCKEIAFTNDLQHWRIPSRGYPKVYRQILP